MTRLRVRLAAALIAPLALTACSADDGGAGSSAGSSAAGSSADASAVESAVSEGADIIDVRTPAEFDAGHVEGATNIDVQAADFADRIAALDPAATYVVYCRSGSRSAAAAQQMRDAGLTVVDGGGLEDMEAAGFPPTA